MNIYEIDENIVLKFFVFVFYFKEDVCLAITDKFNHLGDRV